MPCATANGGASTDHGRINDDVRIRLQQTADDRGRVGRDNNCGFGLVDAGGAALP